MRPPCTFPGCRNVQPPTARHKGLCYGHTRQAQDGKALRPLRVFTWRNPIDGCGFSGCERPIYSAGYCGPHYRQRHEGKELKALTERKEWTREECETLLDMARKRHPYRLIAARLRVSEMMAKHQLRKLRLTEKTAATHPPALGHRKPPGHRCDVCWLQMPCGSTHDILVYATARVDGGDARIPLRSKAA